MADPVREALKLLRQAGRLDVLAPAARDSAMTIPGLPETPAALVHTRQEPRQRVRRAASLGLHAVVVACGGPEQASWAGEPTGLGPATVLAPTAAGGTPSGDRGRKGSRRAAGKKGASSPTPGPSHGRARDWVGGEAPQAPTHKKGGGTHTKKRPPPHREKRTAPRKRARGATRARKGAKASSSGSTRTGVELDRGWDGQGTRGVMADGASHTPDVSLESDGEDSAENPHGGFGERTAASGKRCRQPGRTAERTHHRDAEGRGCGGDGRAPTPEDLSEGELREESDVEENEEAPPGRLRKQPRGDGVTREQQRGSAGETNEQFRWWEYEGDGVDQDPGHSWDQWDSQGNDREWADPGEGPSNIQEQLSERGRDGEGVREWPERGGGERRQQGGHCSYLPPPFQAPGTRGYHTGGQGVSQGGWQGWQPLPPPPPQSFWPQQPGGFPQQWAPLYPLPPPFMGFHGVPGKEPPPSYQTHWPGQGVQQQQGWREQQRHLGMAQRGQQEQQPAVARQRQQRRHMEDSGECRAAWSEVWLGDQGAETVKGDCHREGGTAMDEGAVVVSSQPREGPLEKEDGRSQQPALVPGGGGTDKEVPAVASKEGDEGPARQPKRLPFMGISKPLGAHLLAATKEKIWQGEFVELFKLLHRETRCKEGSKEEERELAKRPKVPVTIENWTAAFLIFASVYCEKHPERCVSLFKYMDVIRKAHLNFGGFAWQRYDEEFRARLSEDTSMSWGELDMDLWLQWMAPTRPAAMSHHTASGLPLSSPPFQGRPSQSGVDDRRPQNKGSCWAFNKGQCCREVCRFTHECSKCGGRHSLLQCFSAGRGHLNSGGGREQRKGGEKGIAGKGSYAS